MKYKKIKVKFTIGFIESLPKIVDHITGCWLYVGYINPETKYGSVKSDYKPYLVHRLSASVYYDKDYFDNNWLACHVLECKNKHCFNPTHLYVGDTSSNQKDSVIIGSHKEAKKLVCPQCGRKYKIVIIKTGTNKGKVKRICQPCRTVYMRKWKQKK